MNVCAFGTNIFGLFFCMCPCIFGCACLNVCILMYRTCVAGSGVCGCVMIHPTSTFIPLLLVLYTCCCLYYPPVSFPWCLYRVVPGLYKHLYPPLVVVRPKVFVRSFVFHRPHSPPTLTCSRPANSFSRTSIFCPLLNSFAPHHIQSHIGFVFREGPPQKVIFLFSRFRPFRAKDDKDTNIQ